MEKVEKVLGLHENERAARSAQVASQFADDPGALDVLGLLGIEPVIPKPKGCETIEQSGVAPVSITSPIGSAILDGLGEIRGSREA